MTHLLISFVILIVLLILGVPVMYCFGASLLYAGSTLGYTATSIMPTIYGKLSSVVLLSIMLFILAGKIMEKGKIGEALIGFVEMFVGKIKGALAVITTVSSAVFGSICGSGMATLSCIGSMMMPRMKEKKYPMEWAAAVAACAAPIGMLIPPSSLCIVVAWGANLSVIACFLSTLIPGIILTILISLVSWFMLRKNPNVEAGSGIAEGITLRQAFLPRAKHAFPALLMPLLILGGIYGGIMTATEAAAVAAIYAIPVAIFFYKGVTVRGMKDVLVESSKTTGIVMVMCVMTMALGHILTQEQLPMQLLGLLTRISGNQMVILLMINIFLIIIGMIMDDTCATMLCSPLLIPIGVGIGVNPYQMCAIMVVNIGMGNVTPPTAPFLYMASGMAGISAAKVIKPVLILILFAYVPTLILTSYIPELSTWLPNLILGGKLG
ncbi:MAG: TRAP transporter large permease [Saccharofermentanales bacterium]|jgi:C4-dicarboxylate transporter DctM subunit